MFLLIITILLFVGAFIGLGIREETVKRTNRYHEEIEDTRLVFKLNVRQILSPLVFLLLLFNLFVTIPANTVGVQYSPFTGVNNITLTEGIHSKGFFDKIYKISTEIQTKQLTGLAGQTMDAQYITMTLDVKYQVDKANAFNVFSNYRTLDVVDKNLISPVVQRSVEAITTNYNIIEILGDKRNTVYKELEIELKNRLASNGINFVSVTFVDTDAGDAIEQAIQNEAVAKKAVETAIQEKLKAEQEAQKRVVEATADKEKAVVEAETLKIKTQAEADARIINAKANAESYKVMNVELTPEALTKMWIEKWNGDVPMFGKGGDGLILDMNSLVNNTSK